MLKRAIAPFVGLLWGLIPVSAQATDHPVVQRHKSFGTPRLSVKVGDSVSFVNLDDVPHNAFSLSAGNVFDTGFVVRGESRRVTLSSPGVVEVECAVHPGMKMVIEVLR
jgi:plastocyanin